MHFVPTEPSEVFSIVKDLPTRSSCSDNALQPGSYLDHDTHLERGKRCLTCTCAARDKDDEQLGVRWFNLVGALLRRKPQRAA